jgi:superoxide oxidase
MPRHDPITLALHWLIALLIAAAYAASSLVEDGPGRSWAMNLHGSLGLAVFGLSLIRILWRGFARHPAPVAMPALMARLAHYAHVALYAMMLATPALGLLALWAGGQGMTFLGVLALPSPMAASPGIAKFLEGTHELAANAMVALALLHAGAAIFHQYILRDHLLERMTPGGKTS